MSLDADGFARPGREPGGPGGLEPGSAADLEAARLFDAACPGVGVRAATPAGAHRDATIGPVLGAWQAWATDEEIRFSGSSGGVLTALAAWLTASGEATQVVGAASGPDPRRTVSVTIRSREEAIASSGSRYAPASNAARAEALDPAGAFIGKPCEVSAVRELTGATGAPAPLLLSFFCAGTPSQDATSRLASHLGMPTGTPLSSLRYRGQGWPGRFTAVAQDGREVSASYDDSWGAFLGPSVQWRCKVCPDGVGEHADITAADFWHADDRGYPDFTEGAGISALVARTPRGLAAVERAVAAGVIAVEPIEVGALVAVQPLQRKRRALLLGRLVGARVAGRPVPRFRGFGLLRLAAADPVGSLRTARGS
ncbi:MAG: hypothetical protein HGA44_03335, partial [Cellulomonadaceae bacterium]|nr:hypothetical protein [Cellulomonadaceae bacterium]